MNIILAIIGVWQIMMGLSLRTKNWTSAFVFKIIPFFSGCFCVLYALVLKGVIKIG